MILFEEIAKKDFMTVNKYLVKKGDIVSFNEYGTLTITTKLDDGRHSSVVINTNIYSWLIKPDYNNFAKYLMKQNNE